MTKPYTRTCKNKECKKKFTPTRSNDIVCSFLCSIEYVKQLKVKQAKESKKELRVLKEGLKNRQDHLKELQTLFNKYIRLSKESICISCKKNLNGFKFDAGHFRSVGACPSLRFFEDNVWPQCVRCNQHLSANLLEYRINLVKKIGVERVDFLEHDHEPKHYTIPEILELKEIYKQKIKELSK